MKLNICAIGDISFQGRHAEHPSETVFGAVQGVFRDSDLVIANLENPLTNGDEPVPNKCVLRGAQGWGQVLAAGGVGVVTLANNHLMDYGPRGLLETLQTLDAAGIVHAGAGENIVQARQPAYIEINGQKIAFVARTSVIVSSPSYAEENRPGVAFLDADETCRCITRCKETADIVILMIHWGVEHYFYPSPAQRALARRFVDAGADLILGHHPHVLQGCEFFGNALVCYSLGNFLFDDIPWHYTDRDGRRRDDVARLIEADRRGVLVKIFLCQGRKPSMEPVPTRITHQARVIVEATEKRLRELDRLSARLNWPAYDAFWKAHSYAREWDLRIKPQVAKLFSWEKIKKVRPHHLGQLIDQLRRSTRITSGKSTNPYD